MDLIENQIIMSLIELQQFCSENLDCQNKVLLLANLTTLKEQFCTFFEKNSSIIQTSHLKINLKRLHNYYNEYILQKIKQYINKLEKKKLTKKNIFQLHLKFLIFIAKCKVLIKLFHNVTKTKETDLFSQNFESDDWKLVFLHMNEIVIQQAFIQ